MKVIPEQLWGLAGLALALALVGCSEVREGACTDSGFVRKAIETDAAPEAVGPYSQAILAGPTLYLAGQIGLAPDTGELVAGGIEAETERTMRNLGAVLEAAGFTFADVVLAQVFLADLEDFAAMNAVYAGFFDGAPPARATVEVSRIPLNARVEIQLSAVKKQGGTTSGPDCP